MATPAQISANQMNAQHSTGPRTEEGKTASSRNAYRNGCYAENLKFDTPEQEQSFLDRVQEYTQVYNPANQVELACVQQIARAAFLAEIRDAEESEYVSFLKAKCAAEVDPNDPTRTAAIRYLEARTENKTIRALVRRATELRQITARNLKELLRLKAERDLQVLAHLRAKNTPSIPNPAPGLKHITLKQAEELLSDGFDPFVVDDMTEEDRLQMLEGIPA